MALWGEPCDLFDEWGAKRDEARQNGERLWTEIVERPRRGQRQETLVFAGQTAGSRTSVRLTLCGNWLMRPKLRWLGLPHYVEQIKHASVRSSTNRPATHATDRPHYPFSLKHADQSERSFATNAARSHSKASTVPVIQQADRLHRTTAGVRTAAPRVRLPAAVSRSSRKNALQMIAYRAEVPGADALRSSAGLNLLRAASQSVPRVRSSRTPDGSRPQADISHRDLGRRGQRPQRSRETCPWRVR